MKGSRAKGGGGLRKGLRVLRTACDAFFSTYGAPQTTWGTVLCLSFHYGAYGAIYLPVSAQKPSGRVLTHFAECFLY